MGDRSQVVATCLGCIPASRLITTVIGSSTSRDHDQDKALTDNGWMDEAAVLRIWFIQRSNLQCEFPVPAAMTLLVASISTSSLHSFLKCLRWWKHLNIETHIFLDQFVLALSGEIQSDYQPTSYFMRIRGVLAHEERTNSAIIQVIHCVGVSVSVDVSKCVFDWKYFKKRSNVCVCVCVQGYLFVCTQDTCRYAACPGDLYRNVCVCYAQTSVKHIHWSSFHSCECAVTAQEKLEWSLPIRTLPFFLRSSTTPTEIQCSQIWI